METLKFLMVTTHYPPSHLGGDAVFVQNLSEELARRGHDVHVAFNPSVYELLRKKKPPMVQNTAPLGITRHILSTGRLGHTRILLTLSFEMSGKARTEVQGLTRALKPDVVHWHNTKGLIGKPFAVPGSSALYTAHDYYLVCPRSNLVKPDMSFCRQPKACLLCTVRWRKPPEIWRSGGRRVIRLPNEMRILAPSEYVARRLSEDGISPYRVLRTFVPDAGNRFAHAMPESDTVLYVGLLEPHKGVRTLLEAFIKSSTRQGFKLHMIGEGSLKAELKARVNSAGLEKRVEVPGFLPTAEVNLASAEAAVLVIPSEWPENAPLVVLEAFSRGVPVLGSDQGGLPEILGPDTGSRMFKAGEVNSLSEALVSIWSQRDRLEGLGRMARKAWETRFSPQTHVNQYISIIRGVDTDASEALGIQEA